MENYGCGFFCVARDASFKLIIWLFSQMTNQHLFDDIDQQSDDTSKFDDCERLLLDVWLKMEGDY